jgi:hypothetical protein
MSHLMRHPLRHPSPRTILRKAPYRPTIQMNVDATAMVQAGLGATYSQQIITMELADFLSRPEGAPPSPVNLDVRIAFNPIAIGTFCSFCASHLVWRCRH